MDFKAKLSQAARFPGEFLANSGHAQQAIPSQHRLLNAGGMVVGWWALDKVRDIAFGYTQKTEGEYVEIKREEVPALLRFLHKSVDWDPNSDAPNDQWKKIAYQVLPGVGGGVGAVAGSMYAFERSGRGQEFRAMKGSKSLNMFDADFMAQYSHSNPLRVLAGVAATFSSASGLTFLYGFFLNAAFASANGAKVFTGSLKKGNLGVAKAADAILGKYSKNAHALENEGAVKKFMESVIEPMFGKNAHEHEAEIHKVIKQTMDHSHELYNTAVKEAEANRLVAKPIKKDDPLISPAQAKDILKKSKDFLSKKLVTMHEEIGTPRLGYGNSAIAAPLNAAGRIFAPSSGYIDKVMGDKVKAAKSHTVGTN